MIWPPPREPLAGSIVRLEPLESSQEAAMREAASESEIWTWMDRTIPEDPGAFGRWFATRLGATQAGTEWCFATLRASDGAVIGSSSYLAVRPEHDGLEIGWTWLVPSAWRSGANLEAKLLMLRLAFEELGCMRVEFKTDARNRRSRAALESLPATFEGVFRKHMLMPGIGVRDSAYFSITDEEWAAVRAGLERRLADHATAPARS